jgi:hypothetical protein
VHWQVRRKWNKRTGARWTDGQTEEQEDKEVSWTDAQTEE